MWSSGVGFVFSVLTLGVISYMSGTSSIDEFFKLIFSYILIMPSSSCSLILSASLPS